MNVAEELEQVLTLDQTERLVDFDSSPVVEGSTSTQQLLDELLGRFDDYDSPTFLAHDLTAEFLTDFDA
jgi:hypothetical protein